MPELTRRIILSIEVIIICLPFTALFLFEGLPNQLWFSLFGTFSIILASAIILISLFCFWCLILTFVLYGKEALNKLSPYWWVFPIFSTILAVASIINLCFVEVFDPSFKWFLPHEKIHFYIVLVQLAILGMLLYCSGIVKNVIFSYKIKADKFSRYWRSLAIFSVVVAITSIAHLFFIAVVLLKSGFNMYGFGLPFSIPLFQLLIEHRFRLDTDDLPLAPTL